MKQKRFKIQKGSASGHPCCFDYTVIDTSRPFMVHGEQYVDNGVPQFHSACECTEESYAQMICKALND